MSTLPAFLAFTLCAPAAALPIPAAAPLAPKASQMVAAAVSANRTIASMVDDSDALFETKAVVAGVEAATDKILAAQKVIDGVAADPVVPRPDPSGKAEILMPVLQAAEEAMNKAVPDGQSLTEAYYATLSRVTEHDPYGDAAWADAAMDISVANMQRAFVELLKQARALGCDVDARDFQGTFESAKHRVEPQPKDAPDDYRETLKKLKGLAVFGRPLGA